MTHHDIVQILCGFPHAESLFLEAVNILACPFNTFPTIQTGQDHSTNGSFLNGHRHLEENVENALLLQGCDLGCPWKDSPLLTEQRFNVTVTTGNSTEA